MYAIRCRNIDFFPLKMVQIGDHGILFMNVEVPGSTVYQQRYPSIEKYGYHFLFTLFCMFFRSVNTIGQINDLYVCVYLFHMLYI